MDCYWISCAECKKTKQNNKNKNKRKTHTIGDHAVLQEIYLHELHRQWLTIAPMLRQLWRLQTVASYCPTSITFNICVHAEMCVCVCLEEGGGGGGGGYLTHPILLRLWGFSAALCRSDVNSRPRISRRGALVFQPSEVSLKSKFHSNAN